MSSRTSTMLIIFAGAALVGLAMAQDPRCRGACQNIARNLTTYGFRGFLWFL